MLNEVYGEEFIEEGWNGEVPRFPLKPELRLMLLPIFPGDVPIVWFVDSWKVLFGLAERFAYGFVVRKGVDVIAGTIAGCVGGCAMTCSGNVASII